MTAKAPARRLLSIWPDELRAKLCAIEHASEAQQVKVEYGVEGTTDARPWAVTAAKREQGR